MIGVLWGRLSAGRRLLWRQRSHRELCWVLLVVAVGVGNTTFLAPLGWVSAGGTWRGVWDGCGRVVWWGWWGKV